MEQCLETQSFSCALCAFCLRLFTVRLGYTEPRYPKEENMNVTIQIPDDLARELAAIGGDLSRRALEAFAVEEYRNGRLSRPAMRQLLSFATRDQLDGFLKAHAVVEDLPTLEDFERERQDLRSLGF
jgi:hypothetical protein